MNSYGHYAVDNGVIPFAAEDMIAGTVVELDDGMIGVHVSGEVLGVLAYDVAAGEACTIAIDGTVVTRVVGAADVGEWVRANGDGTVSVDGEGVFVGTVRVPCENRGVGIFTPSAVHLNILPALPPAGGMGD